MSYKNKSSLILLLIYVVAFGIAFIPFFFIENVLISGLVFTVVATAIIFIVTCFVPDTSIYDPYWSIAPIVLYSCIVFKYKFYTINALLTGLVILIWGLRLTINWYAVYKGLLHEDWRYRNYREKLNKVGFFFINLIGLQYVPTFVVYASLVPAILMASLNGFNPFIIIGLVISLIGIFLEIIADSTIHRFLRERAKNNCQERTSCQIGIWKYSRHPNYLGEITFWFGIFIGFLITSISNWYYGIGFIAMPLLFLCVSIPLMEKHNLQRRVDYEEYRKTTSKLLILPKRKH